MYKEGTFFAGEVPSEVAAWCNASFKYYLEPVEGGYVLRAKMEDELAKAKFERAAAVAAITVEVDGMTFDGDEKAQERMARAVLMAESPEDQSEWVLADSSVAVVTAEQLRRACRAAGKAQTALWVKPYQN